MRSGRKLLSAAVLVFAALGVCAAPSPMERVRRHLQPDGELYLLFTPCTLHRYVSETYLSVERAIAESSIPGRETVQSVLSVLRAANRLVGIPEIKAAGASSIKDAEFGFSNRVIIAAEPDSTGWMWRTHGRAEPRLARIGELPSDTALALDFGIDLRPLRKDFEETGGDKLLARRFGALPIKIGELFESLSGDWLIAIAVPDGCKWDDDAPPLAELEKCDIYISAPDERGILKNLLELFCSVNSSLRRIGNVTYISGGGKAARVFVTLEHRMLYFSSLRSFNKFCDGSANVNTNGKFVPGAVKRARRDTLAGDPVFAAALKRLPAETHGAYFFSDARLSNVLKIGGRNGLRLTLHSAATRSIGILQIGDGTIESRELSTEGLPVQIFGMLIETPLQMIVDKRLSNSRAPAPAAKKRKGREKRAEKSGPGKPGAAASDRKRTADAAARNSECVKCLEKIRIFIADYAKDHNGALPPALPDGPGCGNSRYVYFAPFAAKPSAKMPLVADPGKSSEHPGKVNVLFVDGSIRTFDFEANSIKRLCSFLHTVCNYDEKEFVWLIERASQLDAERRQRP